MGVGGDDLVDHLFGECLHLDAVVADRVRGAPLVQGFLSGFVGHVGAGEHAGVRELEGRNGPVAADRVGRVGRAGQRVQDALVEMVGVGAVRGRVHHALRDGDRAGAALASQLIEGGRFRSDAAVVGDVGAAHRGGEHAVAEGRAAQGDGLTEVRVFVLHAGFLLKNEYLAVRFALYGYYISPPRIFISLFCLFCSESVTGHRGRFSTTTGTVPEGNRPLSLRPSPPYRRAPRPPTSRTSKGTRRRRSSSRAGSSRGSCRPRGRRSASGPGLYFCRQTR